VRAPPTAGIPVRRSPADAPPGAQAAAGRVRLHRHEADRVASLHSYGVLDTAPAECFDGLTRLAAQLCATPIAVISLIDTDRQWNLSGHGVHDTGVPPWESVCSDAVASGAPLIITDLRVLPRYTDLPGVVAPDGIRAYAGIPLIGRDGLPLGALCVIDRVPRVFTAPELRGLRDLADQVIHVLELHRADAQSGLHSPDLVPDVREPTVLRKALDDGEFTPYFQPLVDLHTGATIGLEALIRWAHPTHGMLPPAAFLAGLETGTLADWTRRVMLEAACALTVDLGTRGVVLPDGIAVNVSGRQLANPRAAQALLRMLDRHGLAGTAVTVEITEGAEVADLAAVRRGLWTLRGAGVRVVADDFGVGWSNLTRLLQLPLTGLKIDKELVTTMIGDPIRDHMVASAVTLAATMGLDVIAEGVETAAVRDRLVDLGCHRGQGWYYSRAVPAAELPPPLRPTSTSTAGTSTAGTNTAGTSPAAQPTRRPPLMPTAAPAPPAATRRVTAEPGSCTGRPPGR